MERKKRYGLKPREDKSVLTEARCPFCREPFKRPETITLELGTLLGGKCSCGAVYGCDETGKNLGEVHMDTMVYLCGGDWDRARELVPEEDYEEVTMDYDSKGHCFPARSLVADRPRFDFSEKIIFVRLKSKD